MTMLGCVLDDDDESVQGRLGLCLPQDGNMTGTEGGSGRCCGGALMLFTAGGLGVMQSEASRAGLHERCKWRATVHA